MQKRCFPAGHPWKVYPFLQSSSYHYTQKYKKTLPCNGSVFKKRKILRQFVRVECFPILPYGVRCKLIHQWQCPPQRLQSPPQEYFPALRSFLIFQMIAPTISKSIPPTITVPIFMPLFCQISSQSNRFSF